MSSVCYVLDIQFKLNQNVFLLVQITQNTQKPDVLRTMYQELHWSYTRKNIILGELTKLFEEKIIAIQNDSDRWICQRGKLIFVQNRLNAWNQTVLELLKI